MKFKFSTVCAVAFFLAACAQTEEPTPVYTTPEYDKFGAPSCPVGTELGTTEAGQTVCNPAAS